MIFSSYSLLGREDATINAINPLKHIKRTG
jgi:hypothetical protein